MKMLSTRVTGESAIRNGILAIFICALVNIYPETDDGNTRCLSKGRFGLTSLPGRNVTILFLKNEEGGVGFIAPEHYDQCKSN